MDFTRAFQEYRESQVTTPAAVGYHTKHAQPQPYEDEHQDTIDAIANLATATAADRTAMANLTTTNLALLSENTSITTKLVSALNRINTLTQQLADARNGTTRHTPATSSSSTHTSTKKHYCHSCGFKSEHSSWYCQEPKEGHQKRAKASDTMGGSTKNKPL